MDEIYEYRHVYRIYSIYRVGLSVPEDEYQNIIYLVNLYL